jgi:hypothetical protein
VSRQTALGTRNHAEAGLSAKERLHPLFAKRAHLAIVLAEGLE